MLACACLPVAPRTAVHATTPTTPNPHPLTHLSIGSIQLRSIQNGSFLQDLSPTIYHLFSIFQGRIIVLHKGQTHKKKLLFLWILSSFTFYFIFSFVTLLVAAPSLAPEWVEGRRDGPPPVRGTDEQVALQHHHHHHHHHCHNQDLKASG